MRTRRESPGLGQSRDMDILDSYSSRSGETFLTENYKQVFETNKKLSIDRYYLCVARFGTNQLKSLTTASMFCKIFLEIFTCS